MFKELFIKKDEEIVKDLQDVLDNKNKIIIISSLAFGQQDLMNHILHY